MYSWVVRKTKDNWTNTWDWYLYLERQIVIFKDDHKWLWSIMDENHRGQWDNTQWCSPPQKCNLYVQLFAKTHMPDVESTNSLYEMLAVHMGNISVSLVSIQYLPISMIYQLQGTTKATQQDSILTPVNMCTVTVVLLCWFCWCWTWITTDCNVPLHWNLIRSLTCSSWTAEHRS